MTTELEVIVAALGALVGGGGIWTWMSTRRKSEAEAIQLAVSGALTAQGDVIEQLKDRVTELEAERRVREDDTAMQLAVMREQLRKAESERKYFTDQLADTQAQLRRAEASIADLTCALEVERQARAEVERKLSAYLRRFPQFGEGFANPRKTGPLNPENVLNE